MKASPGLRRLLFASSAFLLTPTAPAVAQADFDAANARQFTLHCRSTTANAPLPEFDLDVNLDTNSHYADIGGLDELGEVDPHTIILRRHFRFERTTGFTEEVYSRDDGNLYWNRPAQVGGSPAKPGATCKAVPARQGFRATSKYQPLP
jgi:hypothetical protein